MAAILVALSGTHADDRNAAVERLVRNFVQPGQIALPIGVTGKGTLIWCVADPDALLPAAELRRVVITAGVDGDPVLVEALRAHRSSTALGRDVPDQIARVWIPVPHPDAWYDCVHGHAATQILGFPPKGSAYNTPGEVEAAVLCRFLEWFAPDVVVEITPADDPDLRSSRERNAVLWETNRLAGNAAGWDAAKRVQLSSVRIPAGLLESDPASWDEVTRNFTGIDRLLGDPIVQSRTAVAASARLQRPPLEVARRLLAHYGQRLESVMYQPALALVARLEYGALTNDASHRVAIAPLLEPYLTGARPTLDDKSGGSQFSGHLIFAEWANHTPDVRAIELVRRVAERAFDARGRPREAMPTHNEMSDAVFMACPILCAAGRLTGEVKYVDMADRHLAFMQKLCVRPDGLYRHSPLDEAAWGRGNGFPALGLTLSLTELEAILDLPTTELAVDAPLRAAAQRVRGAMLASLRTHLAALLPHQDPTGAWRQVIDHPGAYRELTATCMITVALARGLRLGWLDEATYRPVVDRAWEAINLRVYDDGVLIDVCTGTGKQKSLTDYLNREAILDRDERGGAMALLVAIEMHKLRSATPSR